MYSDIEPLEELRRPLLPHNPLTADDDYEPPLERLSVDEMLTKYCGEFGFWQLRHFILTCTAWALQAFHTMVMVFADREQGWICVRDVEKSSCGLDQPGSWRWDDGEGWSTVAEWGLVGGEKYKIGLVQALFFAGCMIGAGIFGHLSDSKMGRKGSLVIVCILSFVFGITTSLSPNYWTYVLLRVLTGFSTGGVGLCAFVLATEPIGPNKRGIAGMSTFYFFSMGIALLSGIAYIFQSWRSLYVVSSIPSIIYSVFILPFISESPRWYLVHGKTDHAMKIMCNIAKSNGKHLPKSVYVSLDIITETEETITGSVKDLIKSPLTRSRLFLVMGVGFTCSIVYYGLSLNVVNLQTNLYLAVLLNAIVEMPAYLLTAIFINRFGRKPLGVGTQCFSGVFCVIGCLLESRGTWKVATMVCGVLGIFGIAGTFNLMFVYTTELFPTVVRNTALGCTTQMIQLGAILVPFVVVIGSGFPFMVFGACGIVGGILILYLPETLNKPLYDTMNGMVDGDNEFVVVA